MARFLVLDCETTGLLATDKVVELGCQVLDTRTGESITWASLINPGVTIPCESSAVHHITNAMVADSPTMDDVTPALLNFYASVDFIVAHNAAYDLQYLPPPPRPVICTWRCANHLIPDPPSYSLQALRYYLSLTGNFGERTSHDVTTDVRVCSALLEYLLTKVEGPYHLVELPRKPVLHKTIRFGKHAGTLFSELPADYLAWLSKIDDKDEDFKYTVRHWIEERRRKNRSTPSQTTLI
jgi:exodeoxyribonuclease X